jgi:hypothetical protein
MPSLRTSVVGRIKRSDCRAINAFRLWYALAISARWVTCRDTNEPATVTVGRIEPGRPFGPPDVTFSLVISPQQDARIIRTAGSFVSFCEFDVKRNRRARGGKSYGAGGVRFNRASVRDAKDYVQKEYDE